jgi:hypothetical protein
MHRVLSVITMLSCLAASLVAHAHGGPPAIEYVVASDEGGPWLAELSEGFALREADGAWSFVCPALFGADTPPPTATVDDIAWISGGMDLFRLRANRTVEAAGLPDFSTARVLSLAALDGALIVLRSTPALNPGESSGTELLARRGDAEESIFADPSSFWSALAVQPAGAAGQEAMVWLARIAGQGFEVLGLSASGAELVRALSPWPSSPLSIRLTAAGDDVFLQLFDNLGYKLVLVGTRGEPAEEAVVVAQAQGPIRGPVVRGGEVLFTQDEQLMVYRDGAAVVSNGVLGSEPLSCLTVEHACTPSRLYEIASVEAAEGFDPGSVLLDLALLEPPTLRPQDPELGQYCTAQWLVFQADLIRAGITSSDAGVMPEPDAGEADAGAGADAASDDDASVQSDASEPARSASDGGCSITTRAGDARSSTALSLAVYAVAIYARRRRAQSAAVVRG